MKTTEIYIVHSDINENNIYAEFATKEEAIDYARRNKDELTYVDRVEVALDEDGDIIEMFDSETIWVYDEEDEFSAEEDDDYWNQLAKEEEERKEDEALLGDTTWFEDLDTGADFDALVEKMEENEDMVECKECFDLFPKADCIKVVGVGYICPHCHEGEHCPECDCEPLDYSEPALDLDYSDGEVFKVEFPEVEKIHFENDMIPEESNPEPIPEVGPNPEPMAEPCVGPECEAPVEAPVTKEETITKLVIDEHEAIDGYEKAAVEIEANPEMTEEEKEEALEVLDHIKEEEVEHIEELEELVDTKEEVKSEDEGESEEPKTLVEGPIGDFFKGLGRGIKNVGSSIVNKLAGWATNAKTLTVDSKADIIFGKDDENKSKPLFTVEFYNEDGTLDETVGTKGVAKFPAFEKASHAALEYVKINKTRRAIIRPIEDPNNFLGKTKDDTKFKALQYFQNGKLDPELNALENKVIPAFEEKLKTANLNKDIDKESVKDSETSTDTDNTKESDKGETNKQPGEKVEDPKANETNTPAETTPTETPKNTAKAAAIKKQYAALLKVITAIEAKKSIVDIMKLLKDAGLDLEDTNVSDFIKQVESGEIKSADLVDGKKVKDTFKALRKILFKESLEEHVNEEHPAIESDQELEGIDNAVVDCEVADIIAHSEDEKPLDCKMEKPALKEPLAGEKVNEELKIIRCWISFEPSEWAEKTYNKIAHAHKLDEAEAYIESQLGSEVDWNAVDWFLRTKKDGGHAEELLTALGLDTKDIQYNPHTGQELKLYDIFDDGDYIGQIEAYSEEDAINRCYNGEFGSSSSDNMFEAELAECLKEDTHSKYAKPAGNKVQSYNNALKYAQKDNVPYIYGYTQVGNGKFFALEQPIKCNDVRKCTADFRNQYKRCSTVYVAYPDNDFITEALDLDSTRVKPGDEIKIIKMEGEPQYKGKTGTVELIDGIGQIHGSWGGCALIPGIDEFEVIGIDKSINEELFTREEQKEFNMDEEGYSLDSHDQYVRCGWCEDIFTKDECKFEMDMGWLCPRCQDALYARGETTVYLSNPLKEDIDWTKISDALQHVDIFETFELSAEGAEAAMYVAREITHDLVRNPQDANKLEAWGEKEVLETKESLILADLIKDALISGNYHKEAADYGWDELPVYWSTKISASEKAHMDKYIKACNTREDKLYLLYDAIDYLKLNFSDDWYEDLVGYIVMAVGDGAGDAIYYIGYDKYEAREAVDDLYPAWDNLGFGGGDTEPKVVVYHGRDSSDWAFFDDLVKSFKNGESVSRYDLNDLGTKYNFDILD